MLITGLIVTSLAIDCYRVKDEIKRKMHNKINGLQLAIEKDRHTYKYEVESINSEMLRIKNRIAKGK